MNTIPAAIFHVCLAEDSKATKNKRSKRPLCHTSFLRPKRFYHQLLGDAKTIDATDGYYSAIQDFLSLHVVYQLGLSLVVYRHVIKIKFLCCTD